MLLPPWLYTSTIEVVAIGWFITCCLLPFWPGTRRGDLIGFLNGIFSLPVFTWFFTVNPSPASIWIGAGVVSVTLVSLALQYARFRKTQRSQVA
jgi:hypothetical protein